MKSLFSEEKVCWFCGNPRAELHHIVNGGGNRELSDEYGLTMYLCRRHHERVHSDQKLDESLKKHAQEKFEETHSHEEWMDLFHKNYL